MNFSMNIATFVSGRLFRTAHHKCQKDEKIFYAAALLVLMWALAACRSRNEKKITVKDYPVARMDSTVDDYFWHPGGGSLPLDGG